MIEDFAGYLRQLHQDAGCPTLRDMVVATGIDRSSLSEYLRGRALPARWNRLEPLITYLHGDVKHARQLWLRETTRAGKPANPVTTEKLDTIIELLTGILNELRDRLPPQQD